MSNPWKLKQEMCEIGRRMYERGLVSAFEGNLSARLAPDRLLCTPSLVCKGSLKPEDLCVVDMTGKQLDGSTSGFGVTPPRKRSSEIFLHLGIYRERPDVEAVVHTHAPHATAFAFTHTSLPHCISGEAEVFLGEVPLAPYATPGSPEMGEAVAPLVRDANVLLLANHGTVSCGNSLEEALFLTEILEAYCRTLLLARPLGPVQRLSDQNMRDLMALKQRLGLPDRRASQENFDDCDLCGNNVFGRGFCEEGETSKAAGVARPESAKGVDSPANPPRPSQTQGVPHDGRGPTLGGMEEIVREIVDRVSATVNG